MELVLGLPILVMTFIIATTGTVIYQIRMHGDKPTSKILDGAVAMWGAAVFAVYGVLILIPEGADEITQLTAVLGQLAAIAGISFGSQKLVDRVKPDQPSKPTPSTGDPNKVIINEKNRNKEEVKLLAMLPVLGPSGSWYQNNFEKDNTKGNILQQGTDLWVKIDGVRSFVTAVLRKDGNALQIDQSHWLDEDNDIETTRIEMKKPDGSPMDKGKYTIQVRGDRGTGDTQGIREDEFEVV